MLVSARVATSVTEPRLEASVTTLSRKGKTLGSSKRSDKRRIG
jgi:hypothetical protein